MAFKTSANGPRVKGVLGMGILLPLWLATFSRNSGDNAELFDEAEVSEWIANPSVGEVACTIIGIIGPVVIFSATVLWIFSRSLPTSSMDSSALIGVVFPSSVSPKRQEFSNDLSANLKIEMPCAIV